MPSEISKYKITKNPFLLFSPFLILYIIIAIAFPTNGTAGDENKYIALAENLTHGFFSPPPPDINLGNGPGYPILLMPFMAFHLPLISITILNAILCYLSIILIFKVVSQTTNSRFAVFFSFFWACYINFYKWIPLIITEVIITFFVTMLVFTMEKAFKIQDFKGTKKYVFLSGFIIGYAALIKPVFGYVLLCMMAGSIFLWLINRKSLNYQKGVVILLIAFATTLPYLAYTYKLTGRLLYWGSSGGNNLYWMTSPDEEEYGSWISYPVDSAGSKEYFPGSAESITARHQKDFDIINKYTGLEVDDAYRNIAINNIKSHPVKFIKNCISNIGRILFNYPYSYTAQKPTTLVWLPFNGVLLVLSLFCLLPTIKNWKRITYPIKFLLFFSLVYLGGSVLASAEIRMFSVIVPILLFWIAFIIQKTVKFKLRFD